jgi:chromosome segregation ATPase
MNARAAVEEMIAAITEAQPEFERFEEWRAQRAKALAEVAAAKAEAERHHNIRKDHEAAVSELRAEKERLRQETRGAQNDLHRLRQEYDALDKLLKKTRRENP